MNVFTIVKVLVVNESGDVLLLRRGPTAPRRAGEWDLPGGFVEPGEDIQAAAIRETQEEAGLEINDLQLVYCFSEPDEARFGTGNWLTYTARVQSSAVQLSFEHDEYVWVSPAELSARITYDRQKRMLTYVLKHALFEAAWVSH